MKLDTMYYIALGTVVDFLDRSNVYTEFASTAVNNKERNFYNRLALKNKAKFVVGFDREMDRLVKEYK